MSVMNRRCELQMGIVYDQHVFNESNISTQLGIVLKSHLTEIEKHLYK